MTSELQIYFDGEKSAGLLLAAVAVGVIAAAALMLRAGPGLRAFALTLGIVALAEIALGVGLYLRTGPQVTRLMRQLAADPPAFYASEIPRMDRVQRNFVVIEYVELAIIVVCGISGIALKSRPGVSGVALALLVSASMLLAFDVIAERRGAAYVEALGDRSG